jgi:hypothetical protein
MNSKAIIGAVKRFATTSKKSSRNQPNPVRALNNPAIALVSTINWLLNNAKATTESKTIIVMLVIMSLFFIL